MAKPFRILLEKMSPEMRERAEQRAQELLKEYKALTQLRELRGLTQVELARVLQTSQANVSKIERQTDLYLSTLKKYIQGIGGDLEIRVRMPEGEFTLDWIFEKEEEEECEVAK